LGFIVRALIRGLVVGPLLALATTSVWPQEPLVPGAVAPSAAHPASASASASRPKVLFDKPSAYGRVIVVEEGRLRILRFDAVDGVDQSAMSLDDPASVPVEYVRYAGLGLLFVPAPRSVLMIGLGGGSFTGLLHRVLPQARIDAVEINPVVVEAAKRFFGLVEDENYRVHLADGAAFVQEAKARYDLILTDGGNGDGIPEPLTTDRYFAALRARLNPDGVLVVNLGLDAGKNADIARRVQAAFRAGAWACANTPEDANLLVFATMSSAVPDATQRRARAAEIDGRRLLPFPLAPLAAQLGQCP
jgi:spermidine synthase